MFHPWVGKRFGDADCSLSAIRLLILGESHYPDSTKRELVGKCCPEETKEIIKRYAIDEPYKYFKTLETLVRGKGIENDCSKGSDDFWQSVAFYNFIPVFIAPPADRKRPKVDEWRAGLEPFLKVLEDLQPKFILVCGLDLWWWVMDALPGGEAANDSKRDFAQINLARGLRIPHPSSRGAGRYVYSSARPMFEKLLSQ